MPFASTVAHLADLEGGLAGACGSQADQDLAGLRRLLEPRCCVDRVPGDERAVGTRRADDDLARLDADPDGQRAFEVLL